jgi:CRISPR/Cas system-associated exonuclease Cas4 (RecB family)
MATKPIVAWSHSVIEMFENCPRKYWAVRIQKCVSDVNNFNLGGDVEHDALMHYMKQGLPPPERLQPLIPLMDKIRSAPGQLYVEHKMTLDNDFMPCGFKDWDRAWVRGAADVINVNGDHASYFDWKSGKASYPKESQIELTSLLIFAHFPHVQSVSGGLVFYRHNKIHPLVVRRGEAPLLWNKFLTTVKQIEEAIQTKTFEPTPNPLCGWCPYAKCQFNTNKNLPPQT